MLLAFIIGLMVGLFIGYIEGQNSQINRGE